MFLLTTKRIHHNIAEVLLKLALKTNQSINQTETNQSNKQKPIR